MDAALRGQTPRDLVPSGPADDFGHTDQGVSKVQQRLAGTAEFAKLLKDALNRRLNLTVGRLLHAIVGRADKADRHFPHHAAPPHLLLKRLAGSLAKETELKLTHGAFEPKEEPVVD